MPVDITLVVRSQERAFVACRIVRRLNHFRRRKLGIVRHRRSRDNLVDNLVGKLLQHSYWQYNIIATGGVAFVGSAFSHYCFDLGNISSIDTMSENV